MICGSGGSNSRRMRSPLMNNCTPLWREARFEAKCAKHTSSGPLLEGQMSKKCTPLWREAHFEVNMYKAHQLRTTFGSWDVEKVHAVVARSTFRSQHVQNTPALDHFRKLRCRKSARRCGAKHIAKSKCTKHTSSGPLLEVEISKKCTPLWREAHFEVNMYKTHQLWTTFGSWDVEKVHAVVARSTLPSQNVQNTPAPDHFWKLRYRKSARRCGAKHISKSTCTKHTSSGPLLEVEMSKKCTPLWREAHFEVNMYKTHQLRTTFGSWDVEKVHAVVARSTFRSQSMSKNDGKRGAFEEDLQWCIFRGRRSTRDMLIRDVRTVRRFGRWFPERGCILEHQIFSFGKMILRDTCST